MKKKVMCVLLLMVTGMLFGACNGSFGMSSFLYDDADKYTMGNAALEADDVEALDIAWVTGEVTIKYHSEDTVVISETANKDLNEDTTMYYWVDGDTLRVKFVKSGKWDFTGLSKELTVWLPESMELEELMVDSVSADVFVDGIAAEKAVVDTVSGDVELRDVNISRSAKIDTTSGKLTAALSGELEELKANTVSGAIDVTLEEAAKLKADTTSGEIRLSMQKAPDSLSVDTVSGDVVLCLPEDSDFTIEMDTVSGSVKSELAMKTEKDNYIFGDGTKKFEVDTTSGSVRVEKLK